MYVMQVRVVLEIADESIAPPTPGTSVYARFIRGLGKKDGRYTIMRDIDREFQAEAGEVAQPRLPVNCHEAW